MFRHKANKRRSARAFKGRANKTHRLNLRPGMRGGIRL